MSTEARQALQAALLFGVLFGAFIARQQGLVPGLITGALTGVMFGGALYAFVNAPFIRRQTAVDPSELLEAEQVLHSAPANLVVKVSDFEIGPFAFDDLLWALGMRGQEALGGRIHLTNRRLLFRTHQLNRLRGTLSVWLPTIQEAANTSYMMVQRLTVRTGSGRINLIIGDVDAFIGQIDEARKAITASDIAGIRSALEADPHRFVEGLKGWDALNRANKLARLAKQAGQVAEVVTTPVAGLAAIFATEMFDDQVAKPFSEQFESNERR